MNEFTFMFCGIWGFIGIVFLTISFFVRRHSLRMEERCTERAEAEVVEVIRRRSYSRDGGHTSWHPLVAFEYEGKRIELESSSGGGRKRFYEGQRLVIYHDPDDPTKFYIEGFRAERRIGIVFTAFGIMAVSVAVIVYVVLNGVLIK